MNAAIDPTRLYTVLTKTGLQTKDPVLYQLLYNLIGNIVNLRDADAAAGGPGGGGSSTTINQQIVQIIASRSTQSPKREYYLIGSQSSSTPTVDVYDSPLTNGDGAAPEIIFDSFGDVVMVTGIPL